MKSKGLIIGISVGVVAGLALGLFLIDYKTSSQLVFVEGPSVSVVTEKTDFKKGEPVKIKIINSGTVPLTFSDASYGLRITGLSGMLMYSPVSAQVISTLEPKQEIEFVWDQIKNDGDPAHDGLYKLSTVATDDSNKKIKKSITINIWK